MGAITFTIKGVSFAALTSAVTTGRYAMDFKAGAAAEDFTAYHVPGVDGSYTVDGGKESRPIHAVARYVGSSVAVLLGYVLADRAAFEGALVEIQGDDGEYYDRCRLIAANRVSRVINTGRGTYRVDVEYSFTCYEVS